eukprot:7355236-Pyramimonas_sp.AAC.1
MHSARSSTYLQKRIGTPLYMAFPTTRGSNNLSYRSGSLGWASGTPPARPMQHIGLVGQTPSRI